MYYFQVIHLVFRLFSLFFTLTWNFYLISPFFVGKGFRLTLHIHVPFYLTNLVTAFQILCFQIWTLKHLQISYHLIRYNL